MPTAEQIVSLIRARGSVRVHEIGAYFRLRGAWLKPILDTLNGLVASGKVYRHGNFYLLGR